MDSVNLKETQSAPLNWRNTGSNTTPMSCACCGFKDYMQTISQANYFRMMYPGMPRCKHSQDSCENSCTNQPFISTMPFLQPFIHNSTIPTYVCCSHYHKDETRMDSNQHAEKNQSNCKNDNRMSHNGDCRFDQKVKHGDNPSVDENDKKNIGTFGMDPQFLPPPMFFPTNPMDPRLNPIQQCACGDSAQWACSPLIVPFVSYCLFWNSQKPKVFLSNYPETMLPHYNEKPSKHSNPSERQNEDLKIANESNSDNSIGNVKYTSDESMTENEKSEWKSNEESNFFVAHESVTDLSKKENSFFDCNCADKCGEKETTDAESFSVENPIENDDIFFLDTQSSVQSPRVFSMDSDDDHSKEYNSTIQSPTLPKMEERFENCEEEGIVTKPNESSTQLISTHKNIAEAYVADVAAGDAGGEHCTGYKVLISSLEEHHEGITRQNTTSETNLGTNESKNMVEQKGKSAESSVEKKAETMIKNSRHKTTVVKNSSRTTEQEITDNRESKEEESYAVKRKHACFPNSEGQMESSSKIQKIKTQIGTKDQGSRKQQRSINKTQYLKKEEKGQTLRLRPRGIQTQQNATVKTPKK